MLSSKDISISTRRQWPRQALKQLCTAIQQTGQAGESMAKTPGTSAQQKNITGATSFSCQQQKHSESHRPRCSIQAIAKCHKSVQPIQFDWQHKISFKQYRTSNKTCRSTSMKTNIRHFAILHQYFSRQQQIIHQPLRVKAHLWGCKQIN